jgi:hypothetical protein
MPVQINLNPTNKKSRILVPDSTPELLRAYAVNDRQVQFAFVRHNHILPLFCGVVCWHLQNNVLRDQPTNKKIRVLMDELFVGIDNYGAHHAILVMAFEDSVAAAVECKRASRYLRNHFSHAHHKLIALEPIGENALALFALELKVNGVVIVYERHFELVKADGLVN